MLYSRALSQGLLKASTRSAFSKSASSIMFPILRRGAATTEKTTAAEAYRILETQRAARPLSPHLQIYAMPLSGTLSALHRITGVVLAFGVYGFFCGYAVLPYAGLNFDSASIASAFGALPIVVKLPLKFIASLPFTYHSWNGLRHLFWDSTTKNLTRAGLKQSSPLILALAGISSAILTFV